MQASMITYVPMTPNGIEPSGEGMRIDAEIRSRTTDSLFTTILQKELAVNTPLDALLSLGTGNMQQNIATDDTENDDGEKNTDVCSLLMQLMVMKSAGQAGDSRQVSSDDLTANGIPGVINEISDGTACISPKGLEMAASVILQNDGKAAEVLSALAESKNAAGNISPTTDEASASPLGAALTGITDALRNELKQSSVAQEAAELSAGAAPATEAIKNGSLNTASTLNMRDKSAVQVSENDGARGTSRIEGGAFTDASAIADEATEKAALGVSLFKGDDGQSDSGGLAFRDKDKGDEASPVENSANQMLSGLKDGTIAQKTSAVERALNKFTDDLRSISGGSREIQIVLEPESLGVLTISIIKTESGISAKIKSEDREVAAIISEHLHKLISSMESKGISVGDVDVVYSQTEQNTGFGQHGFSQAREESSRGRPLPAELNPDSDASDTDIWQTLYGGETSGDTTVDYRI